ncbi:MAG: CDP-alcohol phosphatidyltransferase family protein [Spirochaetaceae bacterium]|nr:MAG: CDP-alcohol phosphatidyltransferase family protein [Spirochaetaceae bacterium]
MVDLAMRRVKHRLVGGFARWLGRRVGPMPITLAALAMGLGAAFSAAAGMPLPALLFWLANRFADGLDGEVARARGEACDFGGYVDMMSDVLVYALIPLGIVYARSEPAVTTAILLMMSAFYMNIASWSYLSALLEKRRSSGAAEAEAAGAARAYETSVEMPHGLIEGTETILVYGLLLGVPGFVVEVAIVAAAAGLISTIQRVAWAARHLGA